MKKLIFLILVIVSIGFAPLLFGIDGNIKMDFVNQQIPFIVETQRLFASGEPWWSWNTYLGDNFIGGYTFYTITSPFVWLICLFPQEYLLKGIIVALYLKFIATGVSAYAYFKYLNFNNGKCILGGLCYVFSAFFITNLFYFHFCEPIMVFPLLLIAIEKIFRNDKYSISFLALITFAVFFVNFYFALPSLLLGFAYFVARLFSYYKQNQYNTIQYNTIQYNTIQLLKVLIGIIVGFAMSAIILIPTVMHVGGSGRSSMGIWLACFSDSIAQSIELLRQFVMPRICENNFGAFCDFGFNSNSFFIPVIGGIPLLLIILNWRETTKSIQTSWIVWLVVSLFVLLFSPLNRIFSGFTSDLYTRWLYGLVLFMILAFIMVSDRIKTSTGFYKKYVILSCCIVVLAKLFPLIKDSYHSGTFLIHFTKQEIVEIVLFCFNILLLGIYVKKTSIRVLIALVSCSAAVTLFCSVCMNFKNREGNGPCQFDKYILSNQSYNTAPFRYRTDYKADYLNVSLLNNTPSVVTKHSVTNKTIDDFRLLIASDLQSPHVSVARNRSTVDALLSVKHVVDYGEDYSRNSQIDNSYLELIDSTKEYARYQFKHYIPMGFSYDSYITRDELNRYLATNPEDSVMPLLENLVIEKSDEKYLSKFLRHSFVHQGATLDSLVQERRRYCAYNFSGDNRGCTFNTCFENRRVIFVSVPADSGFTASIDSAKTIIYKVNLGLSAVIIPGGKHHISFDYKTPGLAVGCIVSLIAFVILLLIVFIERLSPKSEKPIGIVSA